MKLLKRAFINLIRMPVRNSLYLAIVFTMVFVTVVCTRLYLTGVGAKNALDEEYPIIATALPQMSLDLEGNKKGYVDFLTMDDVAILTKSDAVHSYNFNIQSGNLAPDELVYTLPDESIFEAPAPKQINNRGYIIYAVNNIMMEQHFIDGTFRLCDGELFDEDAVNCGYGGIIIPKYLSELYDLGVGDYITCNFRTNGFMQRRIRGIYEHVDGLPVTISYITLSDHFNVIGTMLNMFNKLDTPGSNGEVRRDYDKVYRIDFALKSSEHIADFLLDARENGFDFKSGEIIINDKAYKTAVSGLSQITRLSLLLVIASIIAGVVVITAVSVYCRANRVREVQILRCLGMRAEDIRLMFVYELAGVILFGVLLGGIVGAIASGGVIGLVRDDYVAEMQEKANEDEKFATTTEIYSAAVDYPLSIRFGDSGELVRTIDGFVESRTIKPEDGTAIRHEKFYRAGKSDIIDFIGRSDIESQAYTEERELANGNKIKKVITPCKAGAELGYEVGDTISLVRYDITKAVWMYKDSKGKRFDMPAVQPVTVTVSEIIDGNAVVMSMADLEAVIDKTYVYSDVYRSRRYDAVE